MSVKRVGEKLLVARSAVALGGVSPWKKGRSKLSEMHLEQKKIGQEKKRTKISSLKKRGAPKSQHYWTPSFWRPPSSHRAGPNPVFSIQVCRHETKHAKSGPPAITRRGSSVFIYCRSYSGAISHFQTARDSFWDPGLRTYSTGVGALPILVCDRQDSSVQPPFRVNADVLSFDTEQCRIVRACVGGPGVLYALQTYYARIPWMVKIP